MLKFMAKIAEKYAKATNNACIIVGIIHQPKMPASLIKNNNKEYLILIIKIRYSLLLIIYF